MSTEIQKPMSERFTNAVLIEFSSNAGALTFGAYQKKLCQHLFIRVDTCLKELEAKRISKKETEKAPITWQNMNMPKLAIDAVHRIELGLDALVPNHIHPVPYFNNTLKKYDLNLMIGYAGKDFYRRVVAIDPPIDVRYEMVYSTDKFRPIKKSATSNIEGYEFEITNAFDRGEIIGGFGYIIYDDPAKNKLIMVTKKDFKKSQEASKGGTFWKDHPDEMKYKTIVLRVAEHIKIDPRKMNEAVASAEASSSDDSFEQEVTENANKEPIDIQANEVPGGTAVQQPDQSESKSEHEPAPEPETAGTKGGNGSGGNVQHGGPDF